MIPNSPEIEKFTAALFASNRAAFARFLAAQGVARVDKAAKAAARALFDAQALLLDPGLAMFCQAALAAAVGPPVNTITVTVWEHLRRTYGGSLRTFTWDAFATQHAEWSQMIAPKGQGRDLQPRHHRERGAADGALALGPGAHPGLRRDRGIGGPDPRPHEPALRRGSPRERRLHCVHAQVAGHPPVGGAVRHLDRRQGVDVEECLRHCPDRVRCSRPAPRSWVRPSHRPRHQRLVPRLPAHGHGRAEERALRPRCHARPRSIVALLPGPVVVPQGVPRRARAGSPTAGQPRPATGLAAPSFLELLFEESGLLGPDLGAGRSAVFAPGTTATRSPLPPGSSPPRPRCSSRPTPRRTSEGSSAPTHPAGPRRRRTCRRRCPLTPSTVPAFGTFVGMVVPPPGVATETCRVCQVASRAFQGTSRD